MNRPTLKTAPAAQERHPTAFALGMLVGVLLLVGANIVIGTVLAFVALNLIGTFGLSFANTTAVGILLALVKPVLVYTPSA